MSAVLQTTEARFEPMTIDRLGPVLAIESQAYAFPWTQGNFVDSLSAGYEAQMLLDEHNGLLGYFLAMKGVGEVHLLNLTVAPMHERQGWARVMLDTLATWARSERSHWLWLEVRLSNTRAQAIYECYGYRSVGERKNYYPAANGAREHAVVMCLQL